MRGRGMRSPLERLVFIFGNKSEERANHFSAPAAGPGAGGGRAAGSRCRSGWVRAARSLSLPRRGVAELAGRRPGGRTPGREPRWQRGAAGRRRGAGCSGPGRIQILCTVTMRSREGLFILFILAVLCSTGFSLQCYSCLDPVSYCNSSTTCSVNLDTCAIVVSGPRIYHQCWKFSGCNFAFFAERLGESKLQYRCCQSDLCNRELKEKEEKEKEKDGTVILSGKTMLLVTLVLTTAWNYSL